MEGFPLAVTLLQLRLRHAQSLKDKRHVVAGLIQKLKNAGFSVTEVAHHDDPKLAHLGVAFAARDGRAVQHAFSELDRCLIGNFEVLGNFREQIDYEPDYERAYEPFYLAGEGDEYPED